ncbi:hypothetical protein OPKNFCMD_3394 [Methylobacterium crusticola]|uniref:Uncharacterized protein n=2 Tax=Methylobacterium crusticola TaxID=1697972 RepID=A0ABQ4R036_9HYPH|nr:hypothetical protein OPKNFCMD_3394 [Methylobacterium crusticola]
MAEAALDIARERGGGTDLVRRLLVRPDWVSSHSDARPDNEDRDDDVVAHLEAENRIVKAVLRSERQQTAALRARLAALTGGPLPDDVRADRDRWASLVERLLFAGR